jgi:5-methylcytosine-specific restriction endonuclease McrA
MRDIDNVLPRFWTKVDCSGGPEACWLWTAGTIEGYPNFAPKGLARRYLWKVLFGKILSGHRISCYLNTMLCESPSHLVQRTAKECIELAMQRGTFYSPFKNCTSEERSEWESRAKEMVDLLDIRHQFTPEQRAKGHATRGCIPGGSGPRFRFDLPKQERRILLNDVCVYCGAPPTNIDHIQPFARGGTHEWDNRAPACRTCNLTKNDLGLLKFLIRQHKNQSCTRDV